jgi:uncharacterized membrane protein YsdA (DUF1294 family)
VLFCEVIQEMGCGLAAVLLAAIGTYGLVMFGILEPLWAWVGSLSLLTFLIYKYDKMRSAVAQSGGDRVPEWVLLMLALLGGTPGALGGMYLPPRHKTRKGSFKLRLMLVVAAQAAALYYYWPQLSG